MKLEKKKALAAKVLNVGKGRIVFNVTRLSEIKEAITKQDIRDLYASHAISVREIKGRAKIVKRKSRRRAGSIKHTFKPGKLKYMTLTRKLRAYIYELKRKGKLPNAEYIKIRKQIRASIFKSKAHLKEVMAHSK